MILLEFEELHFLLTLLLVNLIPLLAALLDTGNAHLKLQDFVSLLRSELLFLLNGLLELSFSMFGLLLLAHSECNCTLIEYLVS